MEIIAIDAELHADLEGLLLDEGSRQADLWGINFLTDEDEMEEFVEFDSLINIRPDVRINLVQNKMRHSLKHSV